MKRMLLTAAVVLISIPCVALAEPLNTGYNHSTPGLYSIGQSDPYWIKIASYEPPATGTVTIPVAPAWVVNPIPVGWAIVPGARWIGPRSTTASSPGTNPGNPAYSIFRKCFCLLSNFANPQLSVSVRGDDQIHVWLNQVTNPLVSPVGGNFFSGQGPARQGVAAPSYFRPGRNCIYVLVEDLVGANGNTGFSLSGSVNAAGLMPGMALGVEGRFGSCGCPGEAQPTGGAATGTPTADNDTRVLRAIVTFAEARRRQALARRSEPSRVGSGPSPGG